MSAHMNPPLMNPTPLHTDALLTVNNLVTRFEITSGMILRKTIGHIHAVNDVSFHVGKGETLGIVGESGSGKSTIARSILRLVPTTSGEVIFQGKNILSLPPREFRQQRKKLQMVFQDPESCLDPRMTIFDSISEGARNFNLFRSKSELELAIRKLFDQLGLPDAGLYRYPHEFSGGQRQRIGIARALIMNPDILIADEPVSSLDLSVQAQILNVFRDIQRTFDLTMIFIAHNLAVVRNVSDRIIVMYLGKIMEVAAVGDLFDSPKHPYTHALIESVLPHHASKIHKRKFKALTGEIPSPAKPPSGCVFRTRCPIAQDICAREVPQLEKDLKDHARACHFPLA